jgi:hypothetical protein
MVELILHLVPPSVVSGGVALGGSFPYVFRNRRFDCSFSLNPRYLGSMRAGKEREDLLASLR